MDLRSLRSAWFLAFALLFASLCVTGPARAGCTEDAAGMCDRPIACNPPAGGKCTTVKHLHPLTSPSFTCECLVPPKAVTTMPAPQTTTGATTGLTTNGNTGACDASCERQLPSCMTESRTPAERNRCAPAHQQCILTCNQPSRH